MICDFVLVAATLLAGLPLSKGGSHYIAAGKQIRDEFDGLDKYECMDDSSDQSTNSVFYGHDIAVSCCELDGSAGKRPSCDWHPKNYTEAYDLCEQAGYRLCTLEETLNYIHEGLGCSYNGAYNWCSDSCDGTTSAPTTAEPTTASPTSGSPTTAAPSSEPTPRCDTDDMYGINWHNLLNDDEVDAADVLMYDSAIEFDASSLSLTFSASLEYVGFSADGNFDDELNLGSSYWIDFQSFSAGTGNIEKPGSCGNRDAADYSELEFADSWTYPSDPQDLATVTTPERMAYPPSDWTINAESCNMVEYERTFSWTELTSCSDDGGSALVQVTETDETVTLSGTFYVELVSPYTMSSGDYYRTAVLLQQDFGIALMRQVNVLASTGVNLFISTIMAYGRADDESSYSMTVLVQSAEYVQLGDAKKVSFPETTVTSMVGIEEKTSGCLVASSFTCGQIFEVTIAAECIGATDDSEGAVVLSGNYKFGFTPECTVDDEGNADDACSTFMDSLDGNDVVLEVDSVFVDDCDVNLFDVTFEGELEFYSDADFALPVTTDSDPFVIGQDTIYGKVTVDIPSDSNDVQYDFVDVSIETIVVCTVDPDGDELSVDADTGNGGCFSSSIDADGPYYVIGTGAVADYQGATYDASGNEATFSFLTFDTPRTTIYVHVMLLLTMDTESGVERRRMLLQTSAEGQGNEGNAFQSYVETASVQEAETTTGPVGTDGAAALCVGFVPALFVFIAGIFV